MAWRQTYGSNRLTRARNIVRDHAHEFIMHGSRGRVVQGLPVNGTCEVPSQSRPGHHLDVTIVGGKATHCTGEDHQYRPYMRPCKHRRAIALRYGTRALRRSTRARRPVMRM